MCLQRSSPNIFQGQRYQRGIMAALLARVRSSFSGTESQILREKKPDKKLYKNSKKNLEIEFKKELKIYGLFVGNPEQEHLDPARKKEAFLNDVVSKEAWELINILIKCAAKMKADVVQKYPEMKGELDTFDLDCEKWREPFTKSFIEEYLKE